MSNNLPIEQALCSRFCAYYKPGKNEELACQGYAVVERLIQADRVIPFERDVEVPRQALNEALVQRMCMVCEFHEHDCDYMQDRTAPACGGFVLIAQLLATNALKIEEVG